MTYSIRYTHPDENDWDHYAVDWDWQESGKWTASSQSYDAILGPWHNDGEINQYGYEAIINHFGLQNQKSDFTIDVIKYMSPQELVKISKKDPLSDTIGDRRKASEYIFVDNIIIRKSDGKEIQADNLTNYTDKINEKKKDIYSFLKKINEKSHDKANRLFSYIIGLIKIDRPEISFDDKPIENKNSIELSLREKEKIELITIKDIDGYLKSIKESFEDEYNKILSDTDKRPLTININPQVTININWNEKPTESVVEAANEIVELKPNFFGLGINLNKVITKIINLFNKK